MSTTLNAQNDQDLEIFRAPTSFAQQRLWFLEQYDPGTCVYNIPLAWRISGALDYGTLERSINEIIRRHEVLRTTFVLDGNAPSQMISGRLELKLALYDLSGASDSEIRLQQCIAQAAQTPFDLALGPLIRAELVRTSAREHVLLFTLHHIVSDGWSGAVLMRELSALYRAFADGQRAPLGELQIQYADFAVWQRDWLQGDVLHAQLDYWRNRLTGAPPALELPTDRPRPTTLTYCGASTHFDLCPELCASLRALCARSSATTFMSLAAVFNVLLWRYTRQDDICIGYPVANRNRAEIEGLIGFFVNTLVLRTRLDAAQTFDSVLKQVRESLLDADAHQDLPFEKLVEDLRPGRDVGRTPLFQVMLAFNHAGSEQLNLAGLATEAIEVDSRVAKFELTLGVTERHGRLRASFCYNTDLFDPETIARMAAHFATMLRAAVANPHTRIDALPLLSDEEQRQQLTGWNNTERHFPDQLCIHQLFEQQAARFPDASAVIFDDRHLSYAELNCRSNQLAHHLCSKGVLPGTQVAVCLERSMEMVIGVLGILKAGGAYVPLDPAWPTDRHERLLRALATPIVVTTVKQLQNMRCIAGVVESITSIFCLDGSPAAVDGQDEDRTKSTPASRFAIQWPLAADASAYDNPEIARSPTDPAYVIFTSGSTGEPKGVVMTHRPVVNLIDWVNRQMDVGRQDRLLFVTSLCFDLSVYDLFGTLAAGGIVDIAPERVLDDPLEFAKYLSGRPVTFWDSAPASLSYLTQFVETAADCIVAKTLRIVFLSGDWIPLDMPARVRRLFPNAKVVALGGATEAAIWSNFFAIESIAPHWRSIPYGKPIQNARYYVLDQRLQPVPIGVTGDLFIAGQCLASGYFGDPALSAQKFLPDPHDTRPGARMYRAGDNARFLPDGNIEFLGRSDQQVKIRGYRIELAEIEAALLRCAAIREAVVVACKNEIANQRLVAYLVLADNSAPTIGELRAHLKRVLPEYMLPSAYVYLDALPLSSNGKIDRRNLPAPEAARNPPSTEYVAPRTPLEAMLSAIWAEVLNVDRVGIRDNFFELGGYSLLIVQVVALLRDRHGCELTVRDLFGTRDLEELAQRVTQRGFQMISETHVGSVRQSAQSMEPVPIAASRGPQTYRASHRVADEIRWNARHADPCCAWFQYQFAIHITNDWTPSSIRAALRSVVDRHPVLTTRFSLQGDSVWMHEGVFDDLEFNEIAVETESIAAAREVLLQAPRRAFDRLQGPLCRFKWIPLKDGGSVLFTELDHALFDLQSQDIVLSDFAAALRSDATPSNAMRVPLYSDYCRWHRSVLSDDRWLQLQLYWQNQFQTPIPSYLALFGAPDSDPSLPRWHHHRWALDTRQTSQVNAVCSDLGITPLVLFMGFLRWWALHQQQVSAFDMETDVLGRVNSEFNRTVGFFSTNLVLRFISDARMTLHEVIEDTAGLFADGLAHQELPFFALKQIANPALDDANYHWPIKFSQQTSVLDAASRSASAEEFKPLQLGIAGGGAHPLCIYLTGGPNAWRLDYLHDTGVISRQTIADLAQSWAESLWTIP